MAAHTDNSVLVEAPRDFVWARMMNIEDWPNLFSEYAQAEVIEQDGDRVQFRLTTHPDPEYDGQVWSWVSERAADPDNYSRSRAGSRPGRSSSWSIEWFFEEVEGGTNMRWVQDFSMKPGAPANDEQAEEYMNKNTKEQMGIIKERLEGAAGEQAERRLSRRQRSSSTADGGASLAIIEGAGPAARSASRAGRLRGCAGPSMALAAAVVRGAAAVAADGPRV